MSFDEHKNVDAASHSTPQQELERLIALLSKFSALQSLEIIAGDKSTAALGLYALERVPSPSQLAELRPHRLEHLALSSPTTTYYLKSDMWTMLHWLVSSGSVHTLQFTSEMRFSEYPLNVEWPTIRTLRIERPEADTDSDITIGLLSSSCLSLQNFDFTFNRCPDDLEWLFQACIPDRPFRNQLRKLTLGSIYLVDVDAEVPSLPLALPALEEFKLICEPKEEYFVDIADAFTNSLQALFPPLDTAHSLRSLKLYYKAYVDQFFDPNYSSLNFDRFMDRTRYPSLVDFSFICQHVHALTDSELHKHPNPGEVLAYRVVDAAVISDWRAAFEGLAAKASYGMRLLFGLDEGDPREAFWSLRCLVGKGQTEEKYRLEGDAACNNVVTLGDNNGQSES